MVERHDERTLFALYIGTLLRKHADNLPLEEQEERDLEEWRNSSEVWVSTQMYWPFRQFHHSLNVLEHHLEHHRQMEDERQIQTMEESSTTEIEPFHKWPTQATASHMFSIRN